MYDKIEILTIKDQFNDILEGLGASACFGLSVEGDKIIISALINDIAYPKHTYTYDYNLANHINIMIIKAWLFDILDGVSNL